MMKTLFAIFLSAATLMAQVALTLTGPATAKPGTNIILTLTATGATDTGAAALQWSASGFPASGITWTNGIGAAATTAQKDNLNCSNGTCGLWGMNTNVIPNGVVATYQVALQARLSPGTVTINLTNPVAVSAAGSPVTVTAGTPYTLVIPSKWDLNGDGVVDITDVQTMVSQVVGGTCTNDINGDGKCDIIDVFAVIMKALGL